MKSSSVVQSLAALVVALGSVVMTDQSSQAQRGRARFYCGTDAGKPATIAEHPNRGNITLIVWSSPYFLNSGWNPQRRCEQVSRKFQQNQESRNLNYIVSGRFNDYPVLCASRQVYSQVINCNDSAVLMTLRRGDDSQEFIQQIADVNADRSANPLQHSAEILQSRRGSNLQAIDVGVMLRYSAPTVSGGSALPSCNEVVFGPCQ